MHDFMPRVGFAYSPGTSGNTSIRGGFGLGYDVLYDNIGTTERPPQIGSTANCPNPAPVVTPFLATGGIASAHPAESRFWIRRRPGQNTSAFLPNNVQYPYSESWNLGVQRVFAKDYTAEVRYVGTRGIDLTVQNVLNSLPAPRLRMHLPTFLQAPSQATAERVARSLAEPRPNLQRGPS